MPKVEIDYANTIFYKICCVNPDTTDMYIGHTTNFVQRKHGHKQSCINTKSINYNSKLYTYIRNHGGWDNWNMEIIAFHNCKDKYAARIYEQKYFKEYNATLNSVQPFAPPKIKLKNEREIKEPLYCNTCNVYFATTNLHEVHNKTKKHINGLDKMTDKKNEKNKTYYICEKCNFKCSYKCNYTRHIMTTKHILLTTVDKKSNKEFNCECGKVYKSRQGLQQHKKKCTYIQENEQEEEEKETVIEKKEEMPDYKELLILAMTQMQTQQTQMQRKDDLVSEAMTQMSEMRKQMTAMRKINNELVTKMTDIAIKT